MMRITVAASGSTGIDRLYASIPAAVGLLCTAQVIKSACGNNCQHRQPFCLAPVVVHELFDLALKERENRAQHRSARPAREVATASSSRQ